MSTINPSIAWDNQVKAHQEKDQRPNILILMTDQQRYDTIHAAGYSFMKTPNIDRLAQEGCLFKNAFTPNPICLSARSNLLTGLTARHHKLSDNIFGQGLPPELPTLPRILSDNGYETRAIGKLHHIPPRRHNGFEKIELMEEIPAYREADEYAMYLKQVGWGHIQNIHGVRNLLYMAPQRSLLPEKHHGTSWVGDRTVDFIKTNQGRHPFFLFTSWIAPHPPFNVVDEYADLYQGADLPEPALPQTPHSPLAEENRIIADLPNRHYVRRMRELYYAAISHVDTYVGKILDALEAIGQLDNTLIFFISDHGEMLGDLGLYQKWLPYDAATRIPFIVRYPKKFEKGTTREAFVDLNDVLPSILEVTGIPYPGPLNLAGASIFQKDSPQERDCQYVEYSYGNRRWISLRTHHFKYNYYYGGGREELFDLKTDPAESQNLLYGGGTTPLNNTKSKLRNRLISYEEKQGLAGTIEKGDFKPFPPYIPSPTRNRAFPLFSKKITDPGEQANLNPLLGEVVNAVKKEPTVRLADLDLKSWQKNGNFSNEEIRLILKRTS